MKHPCNMSHSFYNLGCNPSLNTKIYPRIEILTPTDRLCKRCVTEMSLIYYRGVTEKSLRYYRGVTEKALRFYRGVTEMSQR